MYLTICGGRLPCNLQENNITADLTNFASAATLQSQPQSHSSAHKFN